MRDSLSIAIPCRASEPGLLATLESLREAYLHPQLPTGFVTELLICINGIRRGEDCRPLHAVREFCQRYHTEYKEVWIDDQEAESETEWANGRTGGAETTPPFFVAHSPIRSFVHSPSFSLSSQFISSSLRCTILLTERKGKPLAWNMLWRRAQGTLVLFSDADVRVDCESVWALYTRMQQDPALNLVAAREEPFVSEGSTIWSRMGAIPYRFNFGNAGGRLLLLRKTVLPDGMPENLLLEDAWLTVAVGRSHVAKAMNACVYFIPPVTWSDYFAERVRTEGGKLQIAREHGRLLAAGPIAEYDWSHFWRELSLREYPLVALSQMIKAIARLWARFAVTRQDFYALYRPFSSTKEWRASRQ